MPDPVEIWMSIVGISMALAGLPQIARILKQNSSEDVSVLMFSIFIFGQAWWIWYGFRVSSLSIQLTNSVGIVVNTIIVILILRFRMGSPRL